jgi:glutamine amidotransferase PdxT
MKIGVLALQGAFIEHISAMQQIGVEARTILLPNQLDNLDVDAEFWIGTTIERTG